MKVTALIEHEVEIVAARVSVHVRFEEDDIPNDFPLRNGDLWEATIDIDTGRIRNWPKGKTGDMHMKVCDEGGYYLLDEQGKVVHTREQDYVPSWMPGDHYGDYIILKIDGDGMIENWSRKCHAEAIESYIDANN